MSVANCEESCSVLCIIVFLRGGRHATFLRVLIDGYLPNEEENEIPNKKKKKKNQLNEMIQKQILKVRILDFISIQVDQHQHPFYLRSLIWLFFFLTSVMKSGSIGLLHSMIGN